MSAASYGLLMERLPDSNGDDEMDAERDRATFGNENWQSATGSPSDLFERTGRDDASIDEVFQALTQRETLGLFYELPDFSVSPEIAAELKHRRWYGLVEIALPDLFQGIAGEVLEDFVADHLQGREPLPVAEGGVFRVTFALHDDSAQTAADVARFAAGLARFVDAYPGAIVQQRTLYLDTSQYDHFGPDDRWPFTL